MISTFEEIFPLLIRDEGTKYTDDPDDRGGATKYGITYDRLKFWRKTSITKNDVKNLTLEEAKKIYMAHYWSGPCKSDLLPKGLDYTVFDFGVNSGPTRSARMLQQIVGSYVDGDIGHDTLIKLNKYIDSHGHDGIIIKYNSTRRKYLRTLDTFWKYGKGWLARVDRVEKKSLELCGGSK